MEKQTVKILWNRQIQPLYFHLGLEATGYSDVIPGQFVMIRRKGQMEPFFSRPFSIYGLISDNRGIEILYKIVGKGTQKLSELKKGEELELTGPLGNGFNVPGNSKKIFCVAGGVGVPPVVFLLNKLKETDDRLKGCEMFLGGQSGKDLLCEKDLKDMGVTTHITTDDGSLGEKGLVTSPLKKRIKQNRPDIIFACGPLPMLKAVSQIAKENKIPCQVSIETIMACGFGACSGCCVESKTDDDKYLHVCTDGPVFDSELLNLTSS